MNRGELEHVIRAATTIVVIGSQAILGRYPDAPGELLLSKYAAGPEKDGEYVRAALRHRQADRATLL